MTCNKITFGFGFQRFTMDLEAEKSDFIEKTQNTYNGYLL